MTTKELKHKLIERVNELEDDIMLHDLIQLIDAYKGDDEVYKLSDKHIKAIREAVEQIENGDCLTNEESDKLTNEWLNK